MEVYEAYANIEKIITYGFLPLGMRYRGNSLLLKTIGDKEYQFLLFLGGEDAVEYSLNRMVYSTFLINGVNYLVDREKNFKELKDFYQGLPTSFYKTIHGKIGEIYKVYVDSLEYLEGFSYTPKSRHLWKVFNNNTANMGFYQGIAGSHNIGLNSVQENWIVMNRHMDDEEDYEVNFKLSLMVASSFAGKGAKELGSKFDFQKKELEELRKEIAKYGYDKKRIVKQKKEEIWARPIRTSEDLVRELNRQMSGDKDKHDLFIEKWLERQKKRAEEARKSVEKKQEDFKKNIQVIVDESTIEPSRIATHEDIERLKESPNKRKGLSVPIDAYERTDEHSDVVKKVSRTIIGPDKGK